MALPRLLKRSASKANQPSSQPDSPAAYLSLLFTDTAVQAAWWQLEHNQPRIKGVSQIYHYTTSRDGIEKADAALQDLGPEAENISQVMFGLESGWVTAAGIKADRKQFLRDVTRQLSLQAAGFAVIQEALLHDLAAATGASLLLVMLSDHTTSVNLIERGSIVGQERVGRSDDVASDLTEALARFKPDDAAQADGRRLPAKIVLAAGLIDEGILIRSQQQLLDEAWQESQPFVHQPVVELKTAHGVMETVANHGGAAMIAARQTGGQPDQDDRTDQPDQTDPASVTQSSFGVPIAQSSLSDLPPPPAQPTSPAPPQGDASPPGSDDGDDAPNRQPPPIGGRGLVYRLRQLLADDARHLGKWWYHHRWFGLAGFGLGLTVLLVIGAAFTIWGKTASISVDLESMTVNQDVGIRLDPTVDSSDPDQLILKADLTSTEVSTSGTALTTGAKIVGERATGKVTIFNKTDQDRTFAAGTVLTAGDLEFTLDDEVQVASASVTTSDASETRTFGQADASVTASEVGADSNLAEGTELLVADFAAASFEAQAARAFEGGASQEVRVVAEQDRDDLRSELTQELIEQADQEFARDSGNGRYYVGTGELTVHQLDFDHQVGDEADQLGLTMTARVEALRYDTADLTPLATAVLADQVPEGYQLDESQTEILSRPAEVTDSEVVELDVNLSAPIRPQVDPDQVAASAAGLTIGEAESVVRQQPGVGDVTIRLSPFWAHQWSPRLPTAENITVTITNDV